MCACEFSDLFIHDRLVFYCLTTVSFRKRRGHQPTGPAKATGFSSVTEMLTAEDSDNGKVGNSMNGSLENLGTLKITVADFVICCIIFFI